MKKITKCIMLGLGLLAGVLAGQVFGQGSLTPPGVPEATMRTLDEIYTRAEAAEMSALDAGRIAEPRMAITNLPYTISAAGSYYLAGNLSGTFAGITINADNVTLDLGGFTLSGDTTGDAIAAGARRNIEIRNGTLQYWNYGLNLSAASHVRLINLNVMSNSNHGVLLGDDSQVQDCRACGNAFMGIFTGRRCSITDCVVSENGTGGIDAGYEAWVTGCRVEGNQGGGIGVNADGMVQNCIAMNNGLGGSGANIGVGGGIGYCRVIGNQIKYGPTGLLLSGSKNVVSDNYVQGCTDNYNFSDGNQLNLLLCEVPESLDWPCSVKFAGTLTCTSTTTNGISVRASNVTIDMGGHALIGPGNPSCNGINQEFSHKDLRVLNGNVSGWRGTYKAGVWIHGGNASISDIQASTNWFGFHVYRTKITGCQASGNLYYGITAGYGSTLDGCVANDNAGTGIYAEQGCTLSSCESRYNSVGIVALYGCALMNCSVTENKTIGIYASMGTTISGSTAQYNQGDGIHLGFGCSAYDSMAFNNATNGIYAGSDCVISACNARENDLHGIVVQQEGNAILNNTSCRNNESGIYVHGKRNRIENNHCAGDNYGLYFYDNGDLDRADNNIAMRNTCANSTVEDFHLGTSNRVANIDWDGSSFEANNNYSIP